MRGPATKQEPRSIPNDSAAIWDLVIEDMKERDRFGERKHGTRLQVGNGRDHLVDLYQELLDAVVYCRQEIERRRGGQRQDFEAWILAPPYEKNVERFRDAANVAWVGQYKDIAVQLAWEAWQAAGGLEA